MTRGDGREHTSEFSATVLLNLANTHPVHYHALMAHTFGLCMIAERERGTHTSHTPLLLLFETNRPTSRDDKSNA